MKEVLQNNESVMYKDVQRIASWVILVSGAHVLRIVEEETKLEQEKSASKLKIMVHHVANKALVRPEHATYMTVQLTVSLENGKTGLPVIDHVMVVVSSGQERSRHLLNTGVNFAKEMPKNRKFVTRNHAQLIVSGMSGTNGNNAVSLAEEESPQEQGISNNTHN